MCYKNNAVTPPGLEPRLAVPKTDVLPLHHGAIMVVLLLERKDKPKSSLCKVSGIFFLEKY